WCTATCSPREPSAQRCCARPRFDARARVAAAGAHRVAVRPGAARRRDGRGRGGHRELHEALASVGWSPPLERIAAADPDAGEVTRIFDLLRAHALAVRA